MSILSTASKSWWKSGICRPQNTVVIDQRENRPLLPLQHPAYFHWINFSASFPSCAVIPARSKFSFKLFYCDVAVSVRFHSRCRLRKRLPGFPWVHTSLILGNQTFCPLRCPRASSRDVAGHVASAAGSTRGHGHVQSPQPQLTALWSGFPFPFAAALPVVSPAGSILRRAFGSSRSWLGTFAFPRMWP